MLGWACGARSGLDTCRRRPACGQFRSGSCVLYRLHQAMTIHMLRRVVPCSAGSLRVSAESALSVQNKICKRAPLLCRAADVGLDVWTRAPPCTTGTLWSGNRRIQDQDAHVFELGSTQRSINNQAVMRWQSTLDQGWQCYGSRIVPCIDRKWSPLGYTKDLHLSQDQRASKQSESAKSTMAPTKAV